MKLYELDYGNNIKERKWAENEDEACDNASYPEAHIKNVKVIKNG